MKNIVDLGQGTIVEFGTIQVTEDGTLDVDYTFVKRGAMSEDGIQKEMEVIFHKALEEMLGRFENENGTQQKKTDKKARRAGQEEKLKDILMLDENLRGKQLFELWPQKLPRWIREYLRKNHKDLLDAWRSVRNIVRKNRQEEENSMYSEMLMNEYKSNLLCALIQRTEDLNPQTHINTKSLIDLINGMTGDRHLYQVLEIHIDGEPTTLSSSIFVANDENIGSSEDTAEDHENFFKLVALGLESGGGLTIRKMLGRTVRVGGIHGARDVEQCLVWGARLGDGDWHPLNKREMEEAHCIDFETGRRLAREPGVSFGDLRTICSLPKQTKH